MFCCYGPRRIVVACDCPLCGHFHHYRSCPEFVKLRLRTSQVPYHERHPRGPEIQGFMAAGILLKRPDGCVLMIRETRQGQDRFNFIGGKRECRLDWFNLARLETPFETASTEFEEELGERLPTRKYESVYWFPESKFLLFVVRDSSMEVPSTPQARWFSRQSIEDGLEDSVFHGYINFQLQMILERDRPESTAVVNC